MDPLLEAIINGIGEVKQELEEMSLRFKGAEKRLARIESLLRGHDDSALSASAPAPAAQGFALGEGHSEQAQSGPRPQAMTSRFEKVEERLARVENLLQGRNDSAGSMSVPVPIPTARGFALSEGNSEEAQSGPQAQAMTPRFKKLVERLARLENLLRGRNDYDGSTSTPAPAPIAQRFTLGDWNSEEVQSGPQDQTPAELPQDPEPAELPGDTVNNAEVNRPSLAAAVDYADRQSHLASLRGGWGDVEAMKILHERLISIYSSSEFRHHLRPLEKQLAESTKPLSLVVPQDNLGPATEPDVQPQNAHHCEGTEAQLLTSRPLATTSNTPKLRYLQSRTLGRTADAEISRPVFGLPSTPSRRVVSSFDVSGSPFAIYSDEHSPFLHLARNNNAMNGVRVLTETSKS